MLTTYGLPWLRWLDEEVLPETLWVLESFAMYVRAWRDVLEHEHPDLPVAAP